MERQTSYCTSADGTRIAWSTYGGANRDPLVIVNSWVVTDDQMSDEPDYRLMYESLNRRFRLITYDRRGLGASQRDVTDVSLPAQTEDLAAVVSSAGTQSFHLAGFLDGSAVAATYAARRPGQVNRLALCDLVARSADAWPPGGAESLVESARSNWGVARLAIVEILWPNYPAEGRRARVRQLRRACSPEVAAKYVEFWTSYDILDALSFIASPTLVVARAGIPKRFLQSSRAAAASIPNARVVMVEDDDSGQVFGTVFRRIEEFLSEGSDAVPAATSTASSVSSTDTVIILFADIANSTALTERMGDTVFRAAARALDQPLRDAIRTAGGQPMDGKLLGDGVLAVFTSARDAINAALDCNGLAEQGELRLHLGVHAGDVIREEDNVFGGAVNIASRIADAAPPGEVLVSRTVRDLARTSADVEFADRGDHQLKGVAEAQHLFAVRRI